MTLRDHLKSNPGARKASPDRQTCFQTSSSFRHLESTEPEPVMFQNIVESDFPVMGNLFCTKASFADYLGITQTGYHPHPHPRDR